MKTRPILLVEDNLMDAELAMAALKENHILNEIVLARHGGEALDFLYCRGMFRGRSPGNPLAILLDLKMPKVDGLEVLRIVKADEQLKYIPVVMLTSSREEIDLVSSYEAGVNAYVVKPVDFEQFSQTICKLGMFWAILNEAPPDVLPPQ